MSGQFKVGEVLIGVGFVNNLECNGQECVVTVGLHINASMRADGKYYPPSPLYQVLWADGCECVVSPQNLRRKRPPTGEQSVMDMFKLPAPCALEPT